MKSILLKISVLLPVLFLTSFSGNAEDLRKIISLSGSWKFTIGDNNEWANPQFDDSDWDQIMVPDSWEDQGYQDYNGYAWYRKTFQAGNIPANSPVYLMLGRIDDVDVVYLNGKVLGRNGSFPPDMITAYGNVRKYNIPAGYLNENGENVIAVKVYDTQMEGGILNGPIGVYYDEETELLSLNFTGRWKIKAGDNKDWRLREYDDKNWKRIQVPAAWENEVLHNYDGYAWYRVNFKVPENFNNEDIYLCLGKIDDVDEVYLNGKLVGRVFDLKHDGEYWGKGAEYNARRVYKIDSDLLTRGGSNTLAVRVYDGQGIGGIYEGPVGIMSAENYRRYRHKHYTSQSFWQFIYDSFVIEED
ncbi:MAG TPA: beta galactosidase jelly roll domain-containing protein [Bacteroidales bacterium]|nr:beta galactosidase jelly roll domain-containing protein [Bacteroidales bacterium]